MKLFRSSRSLALAALSLLTVICGGASAILGDCGPFTDVAADGFCPFVLEIFTLGITTGTSPTTYDPTSSVSRLQMAAFLSRSVDGVLKRGSRRAALSRFWTSQNGGVAASTTIGLFPTLLESDGLDTWAASFGTVSHLRGTDGKLLETWTGVSTAGGVLVAMGRVFVTGLTVPGNLYRIDPTLAPGSVTTVASNLGNTPFGIAFDGARVWTANTNQSLVDGSVSIVTPGASIPWSVTTVTTGFVRPYGALFDGANIWVTDNAAGTLLKLDSVGAILQTVTVQANPLFPVYDGTNIWVPNNVSSSVSVVRASNGLVLQTLTGNGLDNPVAAAFDGQRVLVTNSNGNGVSLWKAADLTILGTFSLGGGSGPFGACSDGVNFWISLQNAGQVARF